MIKVILSIAKKSIQIVFAIFCIYLIFICLQDLNILLFHSYETGRGFELLFSRGFFDVDLFVKYSGHYWDIIARSLVVIFLLLGAVIPTITDVAGFKNG